MIDPCTTADRPFVISGWSSSYRMTRDSTIPMPMWSEGAYHPVVDWYMSKKRSITLVSRGSTTETRRGFICYEPAHRGTAMVHYLYVAEPYRGHGVARALLAAAGVDPSEPFDYSHRTKASWELIEVAKKAPRAKYNPIAARYAEEQPR